MRKIILAVGLMVAAASFTGAAHALPVANWSYVTEDGTPGNFARGLNGAWVEKVGDATYNYVTLEEKDGHVLLHDKDRSVSIMLFADKCDYAGPNTDNKWVPLYKRK